MKISVNDTLRSGINGGLNKREGLKFQSKTIIVLVCKGKVGGQVIRIDRNGKTWLNLYRGDATGTAGTATAVPNLCQISSG